MDSSRTNGNFGKSLSEPFPNCGVRATQPNSIDGMISDTEPDSLLTVKDAQALLPLSAAWYAKARWLKTGPPYIKVGVHGRVFYRKSQLLNWIEKQDCNCGAEK